MRHFQMRHSFLAFLLLLCFLFSKASGIRLGKGFLLLSPQKQLEDNALTRTSRENNNEVDTDCTDGQCKGNNRKLVTTSIASADTISKRVKNGGHQEEALLKENSTEDEKHGVGNGKTSKANFSSVSEHHEIVHENYPDLTDIAEMDYSPARRKPPIHN